MLGTELRRVSDDAIACLPRRQQQVLVARDVWGRDSGEVSELLAISANYQRVLLHRARSQLRSSIEEHLAACGNWCAYLSPIRVRPVVRAL